MSLYLKMENNDNIIACKSKILYPNNILNQFIFLDLALSLFSKFIQNDNINIIKKLKKLLYYYNRSIKRIKIKYFYNYYYKVMQIQYLEIRKKNCESKSSNKDKNCQNLIFNKTFQLPLRNIFKKESSNNKKILYNNYNIFKDKYFNNQICDYKERKNIKNKTKENNYILNDKYSINTLENKTYQYNNTSMLHNKNNDIIFNYINDIQNFNRIIMKKRKLKTNIISGNNTFTHENFLQNMFSKKSKWFNLPNHDISKYCYRNKNNKKEEEKNNKIKQNPTININNYYILNSSFINDKFKKEALNNLYKKAYNYSFFKNQNIKIKSPNNKNKTHLRISKSKIINLNKNIRENLFNKKSIKSGKINNLKENIIYKEVHNIFPKSTKNANHLNLYNKNKSKNIIDNVKDTIHIKRRINKKHLLNISNKINNNIVNKSSNVIKSIYTRNFMDNYNNSLLTTYYKDKNNGKEIDDSGFYTVSKNTSNRKNLTNSKKKYSIPCSNQKQIIEINDKNNNSSIKTNSTSNKKNLKYLGKKNSFIMEINNKKKYINNYNLNLHNLSFSNYSEQKNLSENKMKNKVHTNKKLYNDSNKIITQNLDFIFIQNEDKNINKEKKQENENKLNTKEKIFETSSETLTDSKIYEMAKLYVQNNEEYLDKHTMEEILKNKKIKD